MFKRSNFCHVASNNRNNVKSGVFIYRTTDNLATVSANGYFNDMIIDINLHDLIIHEQIDASDSTKVERNLLAVSAKSLDNINTVVVQSKWEKDIGEQLDGFVKIDGTSVMTAPLKFKAGSMRGAVGPYLNGVSFWKMDSQENITNIANLTDSQFLPTTTNAIDIGRSANEWKDLYLAGKAYVGTINNGADIAVPTTSGTMALTSNIKDSTITISLNGMVQDSFTLNQDTAKTIDIAAANTDLSNLTATGQNISNWSSNVSNCITEIPQDINLELNSGTLTLKAGSKYYIPNGAGVFDVVTLSADKTFTNSNNGKRILFMQSTGYIYSVGANLLYSGATDPATGTPYHIWYDTTNNTIIVYGADGTTPVSYTLSLPLAVITISNGAISSIDQMFNGFGYIGSTVFALPGVKGLIPNGRNTDGTLKNTAFEISSVKTMTSGVTANYTVALNGSGILLDSLASYSEQENYNGGNSRNYAFVGSLTNTSGVISNFNIKTTFHAVDYNDAAVKAGDNTFTGSNEFKQTVKAPSVYGYGSDGVRTASLEFIDGGNDNIARLVAVSNNGSNAATADLHFNNGSPYFSVPSSDAVGAAVATAGINKAQNGYVKLGNGLIIQWGTTSDNVTNQDYTINFPTAFSSTNYSFSGTCIGQQNEDALCIITQNTSSIVIQARSLNAGSVNKPYSWIAIGY